MTFEETVRFLHDLSEFRMRLDLEPSQKLLDLLGRPDKNLKSVIVSGTNGKGSVCAFLTSIARAAGLRVGTYTSPHLISPCERIALNGEPISETLFAEIATDLKTTLEKNSFGAVTYFEFLTMMGVKAFEHAKVDLAIFEVGLGGRLDTTNALERIGTVTTSISFDHTKILGNTLSQIASEKGAIFRKDIPAVISLQTQEVQSRLEWMGMQSGARLIVERKDFQASGSPESFEFKNVDLSIGPLHLGLRGQHQVHNAACATAMAVELSKNGLKIPPSAIEQGLKKVQHPGRLEKWSGPEGQQVWLDVGHNPSAAHRLASFFQHERFGELCLVIGVLADKDWKSILKYLLPIADSVVLCRPNSTRAWDLNEASNAVNKETPFLAVADPVAAMYEALKSSQRILCTGSFYTVGDVRSELQSKNWKVS